MLLRRHMGTFSWRLLIITKTVFRHSDMCSRCVVMQCKLGAFACGVK